MSEKLNISDEEKIYLDLLQQLKNVDLKKTAAYKDLPLQANGEVLVESFARSYLVNHDGVTVNGKRSISSKQKIAVISYLLSESTGPPALPLSIEQIFIYEASEDFTVHRKPRPQPLSYINKNLQDSIAFVKSMVA